MGVVGPPLGVTPGLLHPACYLIGKVVGNLHFVPSCNQKIPFSFFVICCSHCYLKDKGKSQAACTSETTEESPVGQTLAFYPMIVLSSVAMDSFSLSMERHLLECFKAKGAQTEKCRISVHLYVCLSVMYHLSVGFHRQRLSLERYTRQGPQ